MNSDSDNLDVSSESTAASEPQMNREEYLAERTAKISLMEKQGEFLDKWLLTLAGGALGLTITFLHEHDAASTSVCWAFMGMVMLVISLLGSLFSLNFSQRSISMHIDALDDWSRVNFLPGHPCQSLVQSNPMARVTLVTNRIATSTLFLGIIFVSVFVSLNLLGHEGGAVQMQDKIKDTGGKSSPAPLEKGAVIKPPPVQQTPQPPAPGNKK